MSSSNCCVLFTKPARQGRVKTRLIGALSPGEAAQLHQAFVDDLLARLSDRDFDLQVAWAVEDSEPLPEPTGRSFRQQGGDLGARLFHGLRRVGESYDRVMAVGSDHPEIPVAAVDEAFAHLDGCDIALGPAADGGYYLIAARSQSLRRALFTDIAWSTDQVLDQTLARCAAEGLDVSLLPEGNDVDSPADLERLTRFLAGGTHDCRNTERLLREWGRMS